MGTTGQQRHCRGYGGHTHALLGQQLFHGRHQVSRWCRWGSTAALEPRQETQGAVQPTQGERTRVRTPAWMVLCTVGGVQWWTPTVGRTEVSRVGCP
jgi:hypothetical protein